MNVSHGSRPFDTRVDLVAIARQRSTTCGGENGKNHRFLNITTIPSVGFTRSQWSGWADPYR